MLFQISQSINWIELNFNSNSMPQKMYSIQTCEILNELVNYWLSIDVEKTTFSLVFVNHSWICVLCILHEKNYLKNQNEWNENDFLPFFLLLLARYICFASYIFTRNTIILIKQNLWPQAISFIYSSIHSFVEFKCLNLFWKYPFKKLCMNIFLKCLDSNEQKNEETEINWKETYKHIHSHYMNKEEEEKGKDVCK